MPNAFDKELKTCFKASCKECSSVQILSSELTMSLSIGADVSQPVLVK